MPDLIFFYGTLMTPFNRTGRLRVNHHLAFQGRGTIRAALFDLGIYPAAVPATDSVVSGELYEMTNPALVLRALDELEGFRPDAPDSSLYSRKTTLVTIGGGGGVVDAWVYFYNAPLGRAERIESGDYLEHLRAR